MPYAFFDWNLGALENENYYFDGEELSGELTV